MEDMRKMYGRNDRTMCDCDMPYDKDRYSCSHQLNNKDRHHNDSFGERMPIGMAYVPWQEWKCVYDGMEGLKAGTIFQELELPYYGKECYGRKGGRI